MVRNRFLNRNPLRKERSLGLRNPGNNYTMFPIVEESWGQYATGNVRVTSAPKWTWTVQGNQLTQQGRGSVFFGTNVAAVNTTGAVNTVQNLLKKWSFQAQAQFISTGLAGDGLGISFDNSGQIGCGLIHNTPVITPYIQTFDFVEVDGPDLIAGGFYTLGTFAQFEWLFDTAPINGIAVGNSGMAGAFYCNGKFVFGTPITGVPTPPSILKIVVAVNPDGINNPGFALGPVGLYGSQK